ncbi:MAG: NADH:flavin oxidoreductase [Chloroflexota bacterium]
MSNLSRYKRLASIKTADAFTDHIRKLGLQLSFDEHLDNGQTLGQPYRLSDRMIGNRFAVLPMEGWDATRDGRPTELTQRRWQRFGASGAKLIWGGEATAVRHDGRGSPRQLLLTEHTAADIGQLRQLLVDTHTNHYGSTNDLLIGLQLTHSGRFARPNDDKKLEPQIVYTHPLLNQKFQLADDYPLLTDTEIDELISDFVQAAVYAQEIGFDFVDIKHCHGYLGHEFLTAVERPGRYGGSFVNRTRFLREIVHGIRRDAPGLQIGVRLSAFDMLPFRAGFDEVGVPETWSEQYAYAFGGDSENPLEADLREPIAFLHVLRELDIQLVCLTAGSPYYNPHIQRPAIFPPSDGYHPPEDPLVGVARQIQVVAQLKAFFPDLAIVGSGYSYLQDWLPYVAQHNVRTGKVDFIGLGRMMLSYPELPADVLFGKPLRYRSICRTFSECTTGPRNGLSSGCYPLDPFYKDHRVALREATQKMTK